MVFNLTIRVYIDTIQKNIAYAHTAYIRVDVCTLKRKTRGKDGLFVVSDTRSGLSCRLCKNVCRAVCRAYPVYGGKVFAESYSQVFFGVRHDGDCGCIALGLFPSILVFHTQGRFRQHDDCVPDVFDVFVFRLHCNLHCARKRDTLVPKRTP